MNQPSDRAIKRQLQFGLLKKAASITPEFPGYEQEIARHAEFRKDPRFRASVKKMVERANSLSRAFALNGPSLFCDTYLRNFLAEYNNRIAKERGNEQPTSWNIMRSFVEPDDKAMILKLLDERHFQFNLMDYLDFATSSAADGLIVPEKFDELTIYELNSLGSFAQVVLPGFEDSIFCGAAIVREGDEFAIMGVFGNSAAKFIEQSGFDYNSIPEARREFIPDGEKDFSAEPLFGSEEFYPLIALTRIDARDQKVEAQYLLHESRDSFRVVTDDPSVWHDIGKHGTVSGEAARPETLKELADHRHIFDLLHSMLQFPKFLELNEDEFRVERHPTKLRTGKLTNATRKMREALESHFTPNYRDVLTLQQKVGAPPQSSVERPNFQFETSGFWKTLEMGQVGADKHGNPVHGKTWVVQELTWRESYQSSNPLKAGDRLVVNRVEKTDDVGFIYIMRSPVHQKNLFKIGFTRRDPEDRADDLSRTSGQPDNLLVIISWRVYEPYRVEQEIHRKLEARRLNSRREFFQDKLQDLRKIVEATIKEMDANADQSEA